MVYTFSVWLFSISIMHLFSVFFFFQWPCHMACGILVPQPGTEPSPLALEVQTFSCWSPEYNAFVI